ncbi:TIGR04282 family arsenosugar biosynthesis glycosyltransferase [Adhaeribacter aquaticus]|uniref:TIGR04282 family arsenosugar biosynthesis glycosyltransferase n=1 Tax=Adhaeribacter aquaticus TaxID=299567 RepID=UPI00042767F4|nr:TIGR04282 family arsenosugar biosynthesis glycosyltransferase [Adhaeribacter aquaticus]
MTKNLLIIFVKNPELGKVKTRLAATVGNIEALRIYQLLLDRTRNITADLACDKIVYYAGFIPELDSWDKEIYQKTVQEGADLGIRMLHAFEQGFQAGYTRICIIGSDCYELTPSILDQAFEELQTKEVVIGPSTDGGYYLLGMNSLQPELFQNKNWSTATVLPETLETLQEKALAYGLLPVLTDIDEEKDLHTLNVVSG